MARDSSVSIKVEGLKAVQLAFNRVGAEAPAAMKEALGRIAQRVVDSARGKVPSKSGDAAGSILPKATPRGAAVAFGGQAAPYMAWLNFGGSTGRGHKLGPGLGAIKRDRVKPDRYIYSSIEEQREATAEAVLDAVAEVARRADFDVKDTG